MPQCELCRVELGATGRLQPGGGLLCQFCDSKVTDLRPNTYPVLPPSPDASKTFVRDTLPWLLVVCIGGALGIVSMMFYKSIETRSSEARTSRVTHLGQSVDPFDKLAEAETKLEREIELRLEAELEREKARGRLRDLRKMIDDRMGKHTGAYSPEANLRGIRKLSTSFRVSGALDDVMLAAKLKGLVDSALKNERIDVSDTSFPSLNFEIQTTKLAGDLDNEEYSILFRYDLFEQVIPVNRPSDVPGPPGETLPGTILATTWRLSVAGTTKKRDFEFYATELVEKWVRYFIEDWKRAAH